MIAKVRGAFIAVGRVICNSHLINVSGKYSNDSPNTATRQHLKHLISFESVYALFDSGRGMSQEEGWKQAEYCTPTRCVGNISLSFP
jgi:hypothetical protein